jgi:hypothetical protein
VNACRRLRRQAQRERRRARIVGAAVIDWGDAAQRLTRCDCPAIIIPSDDMTVVEHHHRHGCPALEEWRQ